MVTGLVIFQLVLSHGTHLFLDQLGVLGEFHGTPNNISRQLVLKNNALDKEDAESKEEVTHTTSVGFV